jgi:hypothetical protein
METEENLLQHAIGVLKVCLYLVQSWPPAKELYPHTEYLIRGVHPRSKKHQAASMGMEFFDWKIQMCQMLYQHGNQH